jgi:hypothetical protein
LMEYYCTAAMKGATDTVTADAVAASSILRLFRQMQNSPGVHWDADSYSLVVSSLARSGHFLPTSISPSTTTIQNEDEQQQQQHLLPAFGRRIDGAYEANFTNTHGPELLDELVTEMSHDILELSESAVTALMDGFSHTGSIGGSSGRMTIQKVTIPSTGICPLTGVTLRLLALDDDQRQHVHDNLLEMARLQSQQFVYLGSKKKVKEVLADNIEQDINIGYQELSRFSEWLEYVLCDSCVKCIDRMVCICE